jgi:hypothetical protein
VLFPLKLSVVVKLPQLSDLDHGWIELTKQEAHQNDKQKEENGHSKTDVVMPHSVNVII